MNKLFPAVAALALLAAGLCSPASAQNYPTQPIKLIVAFGPGGGTDIVSRIVGQRLQEKLGQPVVIENRPGAGGTVGNDVVARALGIDDRVQGFVLDEDELARVLGDVPTLGDDDRDEVSHEAHVAVGEGSDG